ncbi:hybrid sensor histidine kinase/response regulator [bacterium]|nr:hybrid sensor histidine kinase/response regulator [bacterium]MBU1883047.1 hybrid sensor histidine kinase/response regulator [bacterium]
MNLQSVNPKILIVDDNPENLTLFRDILRPYNYDLSVATSGETALKIVKNLYPELILLDVVMPNINGYEVLQELKKNKSTREIPVIFLTAKDTTEDIIKGFEAGVVDYIAKPFHPKELIARVDTHLQKARLFGNLKRLMEYSFHELYTPLSIISSAMQMQELEHEKTQYTQMTLAACRTLQNIYDDLYYSISFSSRARPKSVFDFCNLLHERIDYFSLAAQSRSLTFKTDFPDQMLIEINLQDIERVVDNLLSNSLKYTQKNSNITISLKNNEDKWQLSICNPTSKEIDVESVFNRFYREEEEVFGVGLGLNLVQSICKENNIKINATLNESIFCMKMELVETK